MTEIRPWRELYEEDQDSDENGMSSFSPDSYMQDEIDALRVELIAAEQRNRRRADLLKQCVPVCRYKGSHTERALINEINAELKPAEEKPCLPCSPS